MDDDFYAVAEPTLLRSWWRTVNAAQRTEVFGVAAGERLPDWLLISLRDAGIRGIVKMPFECEDRVTVWLLMPPSVAAFVGRRRRNEPD